MPSPSFSPLFKLIPFQTAGLKRRYDLEIAYGFVTTPVARALAGIAGGRICYLGFAAEGEDNQWLADLAARWPGARLLEHPESVAPALAQAFAQKESAAAPPQLLVRGTPFQIEVWRALLQMPPGCVQSYAEVASNIGRPKAARAVGSAIGANHIAWLIPCHRVIRSDGQLGGYRWGSALKQACLDAIRGSESVR